MIHSTYHFWNKVPGPPDTAPVVPPRFPHSLCQRRCPSPLGPPQRGRQRRHRRRGASRGGTGGEASAAAGHGGSAGYGGDGWVLVGCMGNIWKKKAERGQDVTHGQIFDGKIYRKDHRKNTMYTSGFEVGFDSKLALFIIFSYHSDGGILLYK